jgi:hypothetical protein
VALKLDLKLSIDGYITQTVEGAEGNYPILQEFATRIESGVTLGKADDVFIDRDKSLAGAAAVTYDLVGATNTNPFNVALAFVEITGIFVFASASNSDDILVGGGSLIGWVSSATDVVRVKPGGILALYAPTDPAYAVTATTADGLLVTNAHATLAGIYTIIVIGRKS